MEMVWTSCWRSLGRARSGRTMEFDFIPFRKRGRREEAPSTFQKAVPHSHAPLVLGSLLLHLSEMSRPPPAPHVPATPTIADRDFLLSLAEENEERTMIDPTSKEDPKFKELVKVLLDWINDVLVEERIIVKQLEEDLYDGQVLQKLLEKLAGCKLNVAEVTQSEIGQKQKLQTVLEAVHDLLRPRGWALRWSVDSIHGKNLVAILHLLVSLAMHFRAPIRLPEHVTVQVVVVRKREGLLHSSHISEELTTTTEMMMGRFERDAFDTLFDHAPDKLSVVKKSLITFVNKHLNKLNLEVTELETQFADGVYLVLLMGLLEDYFVPLHNFYLTPESFDQKSSRPLLWRTHPLQAGPSTRVLKTACRWDVGDIPRSCLLWAETPRSIMCPSPLS
uniref:Parvin beta n=1 Tax=Papio anubis TaxID=9555 RepID=A0A8I5R192_PAPAN